MSNPCGIPYAVDCLRLSPAPWAAGLLASSWCFSPSFDARVSDPTSEPRIYLVAGLMLVGNRHPLRFSSPPSDRSASGGGSISSIDYDRFPGKARWDEPADLPERAWPEEHRVSGGRGMPTRIRLPVARLCAALPLHRRAIVHATCTRVGRPAGQTPSRRSMCKDSTTLRRQRDPRADPAIWLNSGPFVLPRSAYKHRGGPGHLAWTNHGVRCGESTSLRTISCDEWFVKSMRGRTSHPARSPARTEQFPCRVRASLVTGVPLAKADWPATWKPHLAAGHRQR